MTDPQPFLLDAGPEAKRHAPATERNRDAIADVLRGLLPAHGPVLEIASGTGEHIVHFARLFPALTWQPSDPDPLGLQSIAAWAAESGLPNIAPPVQLDARTTNWPVLSAQAVLCINMVHIAPWTATEGLMAGAGRLLLAGAPLYLYGPFKRQGVETAASNMAFDTNLRAQNPDWGLRSLDDVERCALAHGLTLDEVIDMPANNLSVIFRRG